MLLWYIIDHDKTTKGIEMFNNKNKTIKGLVIAGLVVGTIGFGISSKHYSNLYKDQQEVVLVQAERIKETREEYIKLTTKHEQTEKALEETTIEKDKLVSEKEEITKVASEEKEENQKLQKEVRELQQSLKTKREKEKLAQEAKNSSPTPKQLSTESKDKTETKSDNSTHKKIKEKTSGKGKSFTATYYAIGDGYTPSTTTANGTDVSNTIHTKEGHRIIAVDTSVIPMNSLVKVTVNGNTFTAKASDTGSAIKGNKIDILIDNPKEANARGIVNAKVEIIK